MSESETRLGEWERISYNEVSRAIGPNDDARHERTVMKLLVVREGLVGQIEVTLTERRVTLRVVEEARDGYSTTS